MAIDRAIVVLRLQVALLKQHHHWTAINVSLVIAIYMYSIVGHYLDLQTQYRTTS